mmetsp:Transcript_98286/g.305700  ORF Transcript_98286/g.305700 Transcript_98286/m.305700 type:complete len:118 (-) Transcript_98286:639-992(-)
MVKAASLTESGAAYQFRLIGTRTRRNPADHRRQEKGCWCEHCMPPCAAGTWPKLRAAPVRPRANIDSRPSCVVRRAGGAVFISRFDGALRSKDARFLAAIFQFAVLELAAQLVVELD